jgi:hypothetical protein
MGWNFTFGASHFSSKLDFEFNCIQNEKEEHSEYVLTLLLLSQFE